MISSDGSDSETDIDDLQQTDSASCELVSSGSGSNDTSSSPQALSDKLTPNTSEIKLVARDGTKWEYIEFSSESRGRLQAQNVLTEREGLTRYANRVLDAPLSAFELLVNNSILTHIQQCTEAEAHRVKNSDEWKLPLSELKAFISLLYVRGVLCEKNRPILEFWDKNWGVPFFPESMRRNRFCKIMRFLRFDMRCTRLSRLQTDKFALISAVWDKFIENCVVCYKPGENITVDEQLFPTKTRCRFTQYMTNKPDKFGIKFCLAVDVKWKYILNAISYLGKDEVRPATQRLSESVVITLVESYLGKGRNVTTNNFFTSTHLATELGKKKTSLVGTLNKIRKEVPLLVKALQQSRYSSKLLQTKSDNNQATTLTVYPYKQKKNVCILSTLHTSVMVDTTTKKKPETVAFYNKTKCGDAISRKNFMFQLATELREAHVQGKAAPRATVLPPLFNNSYQNSMVDKSRKRKQCQVNVNCEQNKTAKLCCGCRRSVCGKCTGCVKVECIDCAKRC